jgi:polyferredoxin
VTTPLDRIELVLGFFDPDDWGRTFRLVTLLLGAAMAMLLVLCGLIGFAVVAGRTWSGWMLGAAVGMSCAGRLLGSRRRQRVDPADDGHGPASE